MTTILVTGGAGFIGSCFVRQLVAEVGARMVVLDKLTYAGSLENLASVSENRQMWFQQGDIGDRTLVARLLDFHRPQWVVNFAAESHVDRSIDAPHHFVETNVVGTCRLLEACLDHWLALPPQERERFRYLQVSTDEVFGSLGDTGIFTVESRYAPRSPYAASKAAADHFTQAFFHTYGLPVLITNSSNNYGPYQYPEKLIPLMIRRALGGETLPIYGDGGQVRDWLHVSDHVRGLRKVLVQGRPGESYLFGGDCELTNRDVVAEICHLLDELQPCEDRTSYAQQQRFVTDRPGHDRRYAVDTSKVRRELGWQPQIAFADGLRDTIAWYMGNRAWVEQMTSGTYDGRRLGVPRERT